MILQALNEYYGRKSALPDSGMAPIGFEFKEIPFILEISREGALIQIEDTRTGDGKKKRAKSERVPKGIKRASGIAANLLWDNAEYVLGVDTRDKPERVRDQHAAFVQRIQDLDPGGENKELTAVLRFLGQLELTTLHANPLWDEILTTNPNLTFRLQGETGLVCQSGFVQHTLQKPSSQVADSEICLITGETAEIERLHPAIKGVWRAHPAGANIVSVNNKNDKGTNSGSTPAFASYGKSQGYNSPISERAAFAYTTALNHLLATDSMQRMRVGDTSTVFWAEKAHSLENDFTSIWGSAYTAKDDPDHNSNAVRSLYRAVEEYGRSPSLETDNHFYILGLASNEARISIRFWHVATVRETSQHIVQHFNRLQIDRSQKDIEFLPLWLLLRSIALLGKSDNVPPNLAGETLRCILAGLPYPHTLLTSAIRRIRAEQKITYERAALIKACLSFHQSQEKLTVSLDVENSNTGYLLGRLFAVLEKIQEEAQPGINATIRDRYYGAASATPVTVFSTLMKLKNHHLSKLENRGRAKNLEKLLGEIISGLDEFPPHLALADQGRFAIGYYHQRQDLFKKREVPESTTQPIKTALQGDLL